LQLEFEIDYFIKKDLSYYIMNYLILALAIGFVVADHPQLPGYSYFTYGVNVLNGVPYPTHAS